MYEGLKPPAGDGPLTLLQAWFDICTRHEHTLAQHTRTLRFLR